MCFVFRKKMEALCASRRVGATSGDARLLGRAIVESQEGQERDSHEVNHPPELFDRPTCTRSYVQNLTDCAGTIKNGVGTLAQRHFDLLPGCLCFAPCAYRFRRGRHWIRL
jgi:hypothetical protein